MTNLPEIRIRDWWKKQNSRAVTGRRQRLSDTVQASLLESMSCISIRSEYNIYTRGLTTPIECLGRGAHLSSRKSYKVLWPELECSLNAVTAHGYGDEIQGHSAI